MKGIFDRLLEVAHWGAFFCFPVGSVVMHFTGELPGVHWDYYIYWAAFTIAPVIILYILKGRLILFPWGHRK